MSDNEKVIYKSIEQVVARLKDEVSSNEAMTEFFGDFDTRGIGFKLRVKTYNNLLDWIHSTDEKKGSML